jgi:hypothetical protein
MTSTPSLAREASHARRVYSGEESIRDVAEVADADAATMPNLVARNTSSRRPLIAPPTSVSLAPAPYMSAVSRWVTPRSRARRIVRTASSWSRTP